MFFCVSHVNPILGVSGFVKHETCKRMFYVFVLHQSNTCYEDFRRPFSRQYIYSEAHDLTSEFYLHGFKKVQP